jgi:hypothetical protein
MNLYTDEDKTVLLQNIDDIIKQADILSSQVIKPTISELRIILLTVMEFVIEKKRKIYGGMALNTLIESVEQKDIFYDINDVSKWDIDFYSPTPIEDAKEICIRIFNKGFKHIIAREAQHDETYTIFAETKNIADITYVPKNIYNKMPFNIVNKVHVSGAHFMMIDYFRVLTDPLTSYYRLEKTFSRLCLMLKHFPLPTNIMPINISDPSRDLDIAFNTVHEFLLNKPTMVVVGMYAYNHLIKESTIDDDVIIYTNINYYEIISTNYRLDVKNLILTLRRKFTINSNKRITYIEHYPLFQYLGYSTDIYHDDIIICRVYHYNIKCTPYFDVPALYFKNGSYQELRGTIRIGSMSLLILYNLINIMRARTTNDTNTKELYYGLIANIIKLKTFYFEKTNKTIINKSLFQECVLQCIGESLSPQMEKAIRIEMKIKSGKKYSWYFNPEIDKDVKSSIQYIFKNSSGEPINNPNNYKINLESKYDNSLSTIIED